MVLLKFTQDVKKHTIGYNLHSTMVLLKLLLRNDVDTIVHTSTFHYGSIKIDFTIIYSYELY